MSTPPFVALPRGVQRTEFSGRFGPLAGLVADPAGESRGTALLIPGFTGSKEDFIAALPLIAELGWRAVSFDLRGQFDSPGPDQSDAYTMDEFVGDVTNVAEQLQRQSPGRLHLLGHSFGGLVARAAAAHHLRQHLDHGDPALFDSLTLLSSGPGAVPGELQIQARELIAALPHTPLTTIWEIKESGDRATGWSPPDQQVYAFMKRRFVSNNPHALAGKATILVDHRDNIDELATLVGAGGLPTLVAYGQDDDRWTPAEQEVMAIRLGCRRFMWPRTAHSPAAEHPHRFVAAMDAFWSDADGDPGRSTPVPSALIVTQSSGHQVRVPNLMTGYTYGMELRVPVKADPSAVSPARRAIMRQLESWGFNDQVDDTAIIVSELVTNAVRHGCAPIELRLSTLASAIRLEVSDGSSALPVGRIAADDEANGRGIHLIEQLADAWGTVTTDIGKTVWAELQVRPASLRADH